MHDQNKTDLELVKFHWEKWKDEASRFWKHATFATIALLTMCMYQLDVLQLNFSFIKLNPNINTPLLKRLLICPASIWLLTSIAFGLVDFLRHRVPENLETHIHNNVYPVPWSRKTIDLKRLGRRLYLVIVLGYIFTLAAWVFYCSILVWTR